MNARWAGLFAPFRWLIDAVDVGRHAPGTVLGAIAVLVLVQFIPQLLMQGMAGAGIAPGGMAAGLVQLLSLLLSLLVLPVLQGGVYSILVDAEQGRPVGLGQIVAAYGDGRFGPLVGVTVLGMLLVVLLLAAAALAVALGGHLGDTATLQAWLQQVMALQAQAEAGTPIRPEQIPPPPEGLQAIALTLLAFTPLFLVAGLAASWAQIGVALRSGGTLACFGVALRAALLNAGPVLLMVLVIALPLGLLATLVMLLVFGIAALFGLLSPALGAVVALLLLMGVMVLVSAISYGFMLNGWRACIAGGEAVASPASGGFEA